MLGARSCTRAATLGQRTEVQLPSPVIWFGCFFRLNCEKYHLAGLLS